MDLINVRKLLIKLIHFSFEKGEKGDKEEEKKEKEKNYAPLHNSFLRNLTA